MKAFIEKLVLAAVCGACMGAVLLIGGHCWRLTPVQAVDGKTLDVVKAKCFQVVDAHGRVRGMFSLRSDDTPAVEFYDSMGKRRGVFALVKDGTPWLRLYDAAERERESLWLYPDGTPELTLRDASGKLRGSFGLLSDGAPEFILRNASEMRSVELDVYGDIPSLVLHGSTWKAYHALSFDEELPSFTMTDTNGTKRLQLGTVKLHTQTTDVTETRPVSSIVLFNKDGKLNWQAP